MKYLLLSLLVVSKVNLAAQDITVYHDTANHFTIGVPKGWIVNQKLKDDHIALSVRLNNLDEGGIIPSYSVNVIQYANTTLEKFYTNYCRPLDSPNEDNIVVNEGDHFANGINYKWILTKKKSLELGTLTYYCYRDGNIYQISYTTDSSKFSKYEQVFKKVIDTFKI